MKKLITLILAALLVCGMFVAGASAEQSGLFEYTVKEDGTAEITGADRNIKDGKIPAELDGYTVTSIGLSAFFFCDKLTEVTIPDTVTTLDDFAFAHCTKLKSVNIPDALTTIRDGVFIGSSKLTDIKISPKHPAFVFNNEMLIRKEDMTLLHYCGQKPGAYEVYWGITKLDKGVFEGTKLTSVRMPNSVTVIDNFAFRSMKGLKEVIIPDSVTTIGNQVFYDSGLKSLYIPASVTHIGSENLCSISAGLTTLEIDPANPVYEMQGNLLVSKREKAVVGHVDSDKGTVEIPEGIKIIKNGAFKYNKNVKEVIIPDSVKEIESDAFAWCSNLTSVTLPGGLETISSSLFASCSKLKSVTIPDGVGAIFYDAFRGCGKLTEVTIPASVTYIDSNAFLYCAKNLTIKAPAGSAAQKFCEEQGIKFTELK